MSRRTGPIVSDHCLLREMERVHGVDVEAIRHAIQDKTRQAHLAGAVGIIVDGYRYILRDGHVVTVIRGNRWSHDALRGGEDE